MTAPVLPLALPSLTIDVVGTPVPQGSKSFKGMTPQGRPIMAEANPALPKWRAAIVKATQARMELDGWACLDGAIRLTVHFWMPRPPSVTVEDRARPTVPPDGDKLQRAVADALKIAGAIVDDSRIVSWRADQWYAVETVGARIRIEAL